MATIRLAFAFALSVPLAACGGDSYDPPGGSQWHECEHVAPSACAEPAPVFADVESIFETTCASCHGATPGGPWPLDSYSHIADWQAEIRAHLDACTMPPRDSDVILEDEDRELLLMWLKCGLRR